ncbi:MAG: L,D-transpeptidase [Bdellovibrionota bacterium]
MVVKPKVILNIALIVVLFGTNVALFAQSKVSESIYQSLGKGAAKDELSSRADPEFSPLQIEAQSPPENLANFSPASKKLYNSINQFTGIPSAFISLGNRQPTYGIVVEKNIHRLTVFKLQDDGNYTVMKSYKAITGKEQGDKKYSGDNRTPEGIYFVVGQKHSKELVRRWGKSANKYGPMAFVLDYPNIFDKRSKKTGFGIWIHGVDKETRILTPFDTEGCVALTNNDVLDVSNYISPWETPVVIVDKMQSSPLTDIQEERGKVLNMLEIWRKSWESSDINTYTGFYSDNFYSLGKTKAQWQNFKQSLAKLRDSSIQVQISEPKILAFKNQLLVEFFQKYSAKGKVDFGRKFLYLHQEGDTFKIIAEKWYPIKNKEDVELALVRNLSLSVPVSSASVSASVAGERQAKN